jgi:hemolysin III
VTTGFEITEALTAGCRCNDAGWAATVLLAVGGALYRIGAVVYGLRRPVADDLRLSRDLPRVYAFAALCHYIAIWFVVF